MADLGSHLESGFEVVAEIVELRRRIRASELVITSEGSLDRQSMMGKAVAQTIRDMIVDGAKEPTHTACMSEMGAACVASVGTGLFRGSAVSMTVFPIVPDFEKYVEIAKANAIPIVCDNTFGQGGWTCKPLAWGADIVVESATKWIGGHGTSIGGIIVDGSSFDWRVKKADGSLKYPLVAGPQESYHGGDFANHPIFGVDACNLVFILLARVKTLRDMGGCIAPFNAFQLIQGLETLSLRCKAHCENANALAEWLNGHEAVKEGSVLSISLPSHPSHELAKKYFRGFPAS